MFPVEVMPVMSTPAPAFDEMTLAQVESGPPIWFWREFSIRTPLPPLPGLPVPNRYPPPGARPMRFAADDVPGRGRSDDLNAAPSWLAEIRLPGRHPDPPMALLEP